VRPKPASEVGNSTLGARDSLPALCGERQAAQTAGRRRLLRNTPLADERAAERSSSQLARRLISLRRNSSAPFVSRETAAIPAAWPGALAALPGPSPAGRRAESSERVAADRRPLPLGEAKHAAPSAADFHRRAASLERVRIAASPAGRGRRHRAFVSERAACWPAGEGPSRQLRAPNSSSFRILTSEFSLLSSNRTNPFPSPPFAKRTREDRWRGGAARRSRPSL